MKEPTALPMNFTRNGEHSRHRISSVLAALAFLVVASLSACANKPRLANHSFQFDARMDSPDIELLAWRYGTSRHPGARSCPNPKDPCTRVGQHAGITGDMRIGDDLYVKWKIRSSGEVFEETVNLEDKLPSSIENHIIRFIAHQNQVYVYLITPRKIIPNPCPSDKRRVLLEKSGAPDRVIFSMYCTREIIRLHPEMEFVPTFN